MGRRRSTFIRFVQYVHTYIYRPAQKVVHIKLWLTKKTPLTVRGLSVPGVGQTISKLGTFFVYTLALSISIFEKKSHPIRPVEGLKLCLDFLCNTDIT